MKINRSGWSRWGWCLGLFLASSLAAVAQYTNGIYAEFNTSMGSFTCRLEYALAPKTVANFIGLATGQRAWLEERTGLARTNPLYNGLIFHRVVSNFVNQSGSPTGLPNGAPGYRCLDEFSPSLRHDGFGVLSMANSGPDSNGSQFFITVLPRPDLNDVHSVFGRLYGGSNVVSAINRVATSNEVPLINVVLNTVVIRRVGVAAQSFDIHTNGLPVVTNLNLKIAVAASNISLSFSNQLYAHNRLHYSTNLNNWGSTDLGIELTAPFPTVANGTMEQSREFFRMSQVQYPASTLAPKRVANRTVVLNITASTAGILSGTLTLAFNALGGGAYTFPPLQPGTILGFNWIQEPYRGFLTRVDLSNSEFLRNLRLDFQTATTGAFTGTYNIRISETAYLPVSIIGNFTISGS